MLIQNYFPSIGSNVTYDVRMLGQHASVLSTNNKGKKLELLATKVGIQRIDVEASNMVSMASKGHTLVIIENPVTNLKVKKRFSEKGSSRCQKRQKMLGTPLANLVQKRHGPVGPCKKYVTPKIGFFTPPPPIFWFDLPPPPCHSPKSDKLWRWKLTKLTFFICAHRVMTYGQNALIKPENVKGCIKSYLYIWILCGNLTFLKHLLKFFLGGVTSLFGLTPMSHFVRFLA